MPDDKVEIRDGYVRTNWTWTRLFEAFWIALLDPGKLFLAAAAILVMYIGLGILSWVFGPSAPPVLPPDPAQYTADKLLAEVNNDQDKARDLAERRYKEAREKYREDLQKPTAALVHYRATEHFRHWPANRDRGPNPVRVLEESSRSLASFDFWRDQSLVLLEPLDRFLYPLYVLIDYKADFVTRLYAVLCLLWILLTWAVFGGALTRMAAVQFARKEKVGPIEALTFSLSKWLSYFLAPVFPLIVIFVIAIVMLLVAAILLNLFLDLLVGLLWFLTLIGGVVMVATILGYAGWPLMYATISVEGSDTFDAVFRSYSYIFQRPWRYISYGLVSLVYGAVVIFFVVFATSLMVQMAKWGVDMAPLFTRGDQVSSPTISSLFVYAPESYEWQKVLMGNANRDTLIKDMNIYQKASAGIVGFWLHLVFLLMLGFAYSYFWTASTIIYYLLRKNIDGNDLDEVYLIQEEEPLPLTPGGGPAAAGSTDAAPAGGSSLPMVEPPHAAPVAASAPGGDAPAFKSMEPSAARAGGDGEEKPQN